MELVYKDESYRIVGACLEVYNTLGSGFLEAVYQEAFASECELAGLPCAREVPLKVVYKGRTLKKEYFADFMCFGEIIVETKAVPDITDAHVAQVRNYLRATGKKLGLLVNFGNPTRLQWTRILNPNANYGQTQGKVPRTAPGPKPVNRTNKGEGLAEPHETAGEALEKDSSHSLDSQDSRFEGCGETSPRTGFWKEAQ